MTTIAKRGKDRKTTKKNQKPQITVPVIEDKGVLMEIDTDLIVISANNYRKFFIQSELEELAEDMARHGVLSSLVVREIEGGKYELVIGERRLKAARLIGLSKLPVKVRVLTDDEADEIRLAENMKRKDPHPIEESQAIAVMQSKGYSIEEISLRLVKSKAYIYNRIKLSGLIPELQELFFNNKINLQQALVIAGIAAESQREFYGEYCTDWEDEYFEIDDVEHYTDRFKYSLKNAPFNTGDAELLPEAGACTNCPFNSATLQSLFPELENKSECSNKGCYNAKCLRQQENVISQAVAGQSPTAIIKQYHLNQAQTTVLDSLPETAGLPQLFHYNVLLISAPEKPVREDFTSGEGDALEFDEAGFEQSLQQYHILLEEYHQDITGENAQNGLYLKGNEATMIYFVERIRNSTTYEDAKPKVTAKAVQEAIKEGKATAELLQQEIGRINDREQGLQRRDGEKVQEAVHAQFSEEQQKDHGHSPMTNADQVAARLIIYECLPYNLRSTVELALFPESDFDKGERQFDDFANLSEEKVAFLIRMVLAGKPESKMPGNFTAYTLYQLAQQTGTDVEAIEQAQQQKTEERQHNMKLRITDLERRITKLAPTETE